MTSAAYRLPRTVVPNHYDIKIEPDLDDATFRGTVGIDVDVADPTTEVVLNAIELELERVSITAGGSEQRADVVLDPGTERATLTVPTELPVGTARIVIRFTGILNDDLRGFYRSVYTTEQGERQTIAVSQFEATDARRAFPCWDQPEFKATYSVSLVVDNGLTAVSNAAEIARTALDDGKVRVDFAETMKMSTYLVAFIVGEFEATEAVDVDGTPLRVLAPPGNLHLTPFALELGAHSLRFFSSYYDVPYPGDKLDMIAIPDFSFGAMENLGCITYRETALLLDPETATQAEAQRVADVIAHEIAHMWFGDLVTMKWWNGIWLNEAFATFAEMKCVESYKPEWNRWLAFAPFRAISQETDALRSTRPIEFEVVSPDDANGMFDVLTYQKGSSVLRMLEGFLGEDAFRAGVTRYLKTHAYDNTETNDLWEALEAESGQPVAEIMDTWILQGGHPRLSVSQADGGYEFSQSHFRYLGQGGQTWQIPVRYRTAAGEGRILVDDAPAFVEGTGLVCANAGGEGFYRVNLEGDLFDAALGELNGLDALERFAFVSDVFANVLAGDAGGADFLSLVSHLTDENEIDVWAAAAFGLGELDRIVAPGDRAALQAFVVGLVSSKAEELGWDPIEDESDRTRALRGLLLQMLGNLGADEETIEQARVINDGQGGVDAEVAEAALMIVAGNGTASDLAGLIDRYETSRNPQERIRYLRAATNIPDPKVPEKMIDMILAGDIRSQDAFWVLARLIGNRESGVRAWELVVENWDDVLASMPVLNGRRMLDLIQYRSEPDLAVSIMQWLEANPIPSGGKHVDQKMEQLQVRVGLREREAERLGSALSG